MRIKKTRRRGCGRKIVGLILPPGTTYCGRRTMQLPEAVIKRDGSRAVFELAKIAAAIARAGEATGEFAATQAQALATQVARVLAHRYAGAVPHIEAIQDLVEQ